MSNFWSLVSVLCLIISAPVFTLDPFPGEKWKTGYIYIGGGSHLFYYLFKTRNQSTLAAPLVIWLEGGPGYSTSFSVFSEAGPYTINNKTKAIEYNPFAWNEVAETLFVDQPAGTHFSYATRMDRMCSDEGCVANDFYRFLQ